jgi:hypothetical protein
MRSLLAQLIGFHKSLQKGAITFRLSRSLQSFDWKGLGFGANADQSLHRQTTLVPG